MAFRVEITSVEGLKAMKDMKSTNTAGDQGEELEFLEVVKIGEESTNKALEMRGVELDNNNKNLQMNKKGAAKVESEEHLEEEEQRQKKKSTSSGSQQGSSQGSWKKDCYYRDRRQELGNRGFQGTLRNFFQLVRLVRRDTPGRVSYWASSPFSDPTLCISPIGALQYLTITRPDIAYVFYSASHCLHAPIETHLPAIKHIIRYVKGTLLLGLAFSPSASPGATIAYSDVDWAGCPDTRCSTSGYSIYLGDNLVS
ncbi:uncharacterized protein LOC131153851 [Malania oleifera]|uniref:uncharacterized protein LOC131153851 n=1 Tax=Malania oleifera TaxID=397392 RepID=UPI0025AE2110|nr:uncharacterized protein LOC131153851 [Malania oleifera]